VGLFSLLALLSGLSFGRLCADPAAQPPADTTGQPQTTPTASSAPVAGKPQKETVDIQFDHLLGTSQDGDITVSTFDNATVIHKDAQFSAELIVDRSQKKDHIFTCTRYPEKAEYPKSARPPTYADPETTVTAEKVVAYSTYRRAEFIKDVKMVSIPKEQAADKTDPKKLGAQPTTITADKLVYNYRDKMGEFTDHVTMVVTPRKQDDKSSGINKAMTSDPSTLTTDKLHYDGKLKKATATGNVVIVQKARTVWADKAEYFQDVDKVVLSGNVRMKNTGEEEVKSMDNADTVTVLLHNDWVDILAKPGTKITMTLEVNDDSDDTTPAASDDTTKGTAKK
jgi:lipopolysaccharide export system protein LptA